MDLRVLRDSLDSSRSSHSGVTKRHEKKLNQDFKGEWMVARRLMTRLAPSDLLAPPPVSPSQRLPSILQTFTADLWPHRSPRTAPATLVASETSSTSSFSAPAKVPPMPTAPI